MEGTGELPIMYIALGSTPRAAHPFNLYHDIMSIPQALADTLRTIPPQVKKVADEIGRRKLRRVIGTGLGTSQFVAMGAAAALGNFADFDADAVDSGDFLTSRRNWDLSHSAFMVYSGSGRTFDSNAAAKKAKEGGAYVVAVTSVPFSPLTKIAGMMDYVVRLPAVDETLFALPSTFPAQLIPYSCAVEQGDINPDCQRSNIPKHARVWMQLFPPGSH